MTKKKLIVIIISFMVTFMMVIVSLIYYFSKAANIMEQIYKAARAGSFKTFNEVSVLKGVSYEDLADFENFGGLSIPYRADYLKEGFEVELFFPAESENIKVRSVIEASDTTLLLMDISYDHKSQNIIYEPISISYTPGDINTNEHFYDFKNISKLLEKCNVTKETIAEYQEYVLYDVVIKAWVDAHGGSYDAARQKMGDLKLIDKTLQNS